MAYCTQSEVEANTGYGYSDFRQGDITLTQAQWVALVSAFIAGATQQINVICMVKSFESSEYVEIHNGRGMTGEAGRAYREMDRTFLPHERPVTAVTKVEVDQASLSSIPDWQEMDARSDTTPGQYAVINDGVVCRVRFHSQVPNKGFGNVRITYTAGYQASDPVLADIKQICIEIVRYMLEKKKREQEAIVVSWGSGTKEGANMIEVIKQEPFYDYLMKRLAPYRRSRRGVAWH